jgi:hypothetical protein
MRAGGLVLVSRAIPFAQLYQSAGFRVPRRGAALRRARSASLRHNRLCVGDLTQSCLALGDGVVPVVR